MADLYDGLRSGGFCTELAGAGAPVAAATDELEAQRAAARRGCSIERAVLMVDRSRRHDADVEELLDRDTRAGVRTLLVDAVNALPRELTGALRFGVWDGEVVTNGAGGVSRRAEDLRRAEEAAAALRRARGDPDELILDEPLARLARLARTLAPESCHPVGDGPDCTHYHGLVQYLRLIGVAASPQRHGHFYRAALAAAARERKRRRVLIAGAADASMLIHVLAAHETVAASPEVTVIDRCATPLAICAEYARERGIAIRTAQCDVVDFRDGAPYDAVITESLLTLLPPEGRAAAVARWWSLLRPGGRLVTTARIAGGTSPGPTAAPAEAFAEWVRHEAERRRGLLDVAPAALADEARRYHGTIPLHPIASRDAIGELLSRAGFPVQSLAFVELEGRGPARDAPSSYRSAEYARVVAVR